MSPETLQTDLKSFLESMETAMKGIPGIMAGYAFEEIALTLEVGAKVKSAFSALAAHSPAKAAFR